MTLLPSSALDAATISAMAHQERLIRNLQESRLIEEVRIKSDHTEVVSTFDEDDPSSSQMALVHLKRTGDFYDLFVHPPKSRIWRYWPLPVLIGAVSASGGRTPIGIQFTTAHSSQDEVRDLLAVGKRPVWVGANETCEIHAKTVSGYEAITHDLAHLHIWNQYPVEGRTDMVQVYDSLRTSLKSSPQIAAQFYWARDQILEGYLDEGRAISIIETSFRQAAAMNVYFDDFLKQLHTDLEGHPRRKRILGKYAYPFSKKS